MAFDFFNQMLRYEPYTDMEDGRTCSDRVAYQDRSRAWSHGDDEVSFYVGIGHRDKQPDIYCADNMNCILDGQVCHNDSYKHLTVGRQNGYQDCLNSDNPQPSSSHVGETGVRQNIGRSHLGETGGSQNVGRSHIGETGAGRSSTKLHIGKTGFDRDMSYVGETGVDGYNRKSYVGETLVDCDVSYVGKTGISRHNRRSDVGETRAGSHHRGSYILEETRTRQHSGQSYTGVMGVSQHNRQSHFGETGVSQHDGMAYVGETGYCQQDRRLLLGETGASWYRVEPNIPSFDGTEEWAIWIARFEAIAEHRQWDKDMKLEFLLPRLQGKVGEYAFTVLPDKVLNNYKELVTELNSAFKQIEIPRAFVVQFHSRVQGDAESVEDYALELRRLYYKAYKHRDTKTREEDLIRRFLEGLKDADMSFAVEFHKDPKTFDEAVYHCVGYKELRSWIYQDTQSLNTASKQRREPYKTYENEAIIDYCDPKRSEMDRKQNQAELTEIVVQLGELVQKLQKLMNKDFTAAAQTQVKQIELGWRSKNSQQRVDNEPGQELFDFRYDCPDKDTNRTLTPYECSADTNSVNTVPFCMPVSNVSVNNRCQNDGKEEPSLKGQKDGKEEPSLRGQNDCKEEPRLKGKSDGKEEPKLKGQSDGKEEPKLGYPSDGKEEPKLRGQNDGKEEPRFKCHNDDGEWQTAIRKYTTYTEHDYQQIRFSGVEYQNSHEEDIDESEAEKVNMSVEQKGSCTYKEFVQCSPLQCSPLHRDDKLGGEYISKAKEGKSCSPVKGTCENQHMEKNKYCTGIVHRTA